MPTTLVIRERATSMPTSLVSRMLEAVRSYTVGPLSLKDPALAKLFGAGYQTAAGISVTDENAFTFSAVYDAVNQSSSDLAKLPLVLRKRRKEGGSDPYEDSNTYWLLKHQANPDMSGFEFRRTLQAHALTCKGAFAEIERDNNDRPKWLWPLTPNRVEPFMDKTKLPNGRYRSRLRYKIDGDARTIIEAEDMIHIRGLGYDGYSAYPIIDKARQAIGLALAAERFAGAFFGNNANLGGVLAADEDLDETQAAALQERIEKIHKGPDRAWRMLVLGAGFKYFRTGVTPSESQMNDLRSRQVEEVARFFNFPVHKLKNLDRATNNNIEHQGLEYYQGHQLTWITNTEGEFNRKLISPLEIGNQYFKHNANAVLRSDAAGRTALYTALLDRGVFCADDVLELEDMNPQPNGQGKIFLVQGAMVPKDKIQALADATIEKAKRPKVAPAPVAAEPVRVRLEARWTTLLQGLPEHGQGYQRVDVRYADGRSLIEVLVFNAEFLEVPRAFADADIKELTLHPDSERLRAATHLASELRAEADRERAARIAAEASSEVSAAEIARLLASEQALTTRALQAELVANSVRAEQEAAVAARVTLEAALIEAQAARDAAVASEAEATTRQQAALTAQQEAEQRATDATAAAAEARDAADTADRLATDARAACDTAGVDRAAADAARLLADTAATEARAAADRLESERAALAAEAATLQTVAEQTTADAAHRAEEAQAELTAARTRIAEIETALADTAAARTAAEGATADTRATMAQIETDRAAARADLEATRTALAAEQQRATDALTAAQTAEAARLAALEAQTQAEAARTEADVLRTQAATECDAARAALAVEQQRLADIDAARLVAEDARVAAVAAQTEAVTQQGETDVQNATLTADLETARASVLAEQHRVAAADAALEAARDRLSVLDAALVATRGSHETALTALQTTIAALERECAESRDRSAEQEMRATALAAMVAERERDIRTVQQADADAVAGTIAAHRALVVEIMRKAVERETDRARRAQQTPEKLQRWLETFYDGHAELMRQALLPAVRIHLAFVRSDEDPIEATRRIVEAHIAESTRQIRTVLDGDADEMATSLPALWYRWDVERPAVVADALMRKELNYARRL